MNKTFALLLCALCPALSAAAYRPTPTETAVLDAVLRDELRAFSEGNDGLIGARLGVSAVRAEDVAHAYAAGKIPNESAVVEKAVLLSGQVMAVSGDVWRGASIAFATTHAIAVNAVLDKGLTAGETAIRAGNPQALVCNQMTVIDAVPTFQRCKPAIAAAAPVVAALESDIASFYRGAPTEERVSILAINAALYASMLPMDHGCPDDIDRCRQAIRSIPNSPLRQRVLVLTMQRFRAAGVDLSAYDAIRQPGGPASTH